MEDVTSQLMRHLSYHPTLRTCSSDTILRAIKELKEEVEKLYYSCIQDVNGDEEFKKRFFLADENPKKVLASVNAYAKNCKGEEILALYDDSSFGNGKVGFSLK